MARYIDVVKLKARLCYSPIFENEGEEGYFFKNFILDLIDRMPTADVVEVVRCKDCKHFDAYEGEEHKGDCGELVGLESCVYEDDFCSYGERKETDADDHH